MISLLFYIYLLPVVIFSDLAVGVFLPALFLLTCCFLLLIPKFRKSAFHALVVNDLFFVLGSLILFKSDSAAGVGFFFLPIIAFVPSCIAFVSGDYFVEYLADKLNKKFKSIAKLGLLILIISLVLLYLGELNKNFF